MIIIIIVIRVYIRGSDLFHEKVEPGFRLDGLKVLHCAFQVH